MKCSIIVATYNRKNLFERVLSCVMKADYSGYSDIDLIISIDRSKNYAEMKAIADNFLWAHGRKQVILHPQRLGLRKHFIFCGDQSQKYGPIIFLEDDVVVNTSYYQIAAKLADKYITDDRIAGASLYNLNFNETAQRPFQPLDDGTDVYFCSLMSWAPVYFPKPWAAFKKWLEQTDGREIVYTNIPPDVMKWPSSSFKKLHIQFMAQNHLYFVYVRSSCATNFAEPGEHYKKDTNKLQVSMSLREQRALSLPELDDSLAKYDTYLEIEPAVLQQILPTLASYNFTSDIYGKKTADGLVDEYVLTTKKVKDAVLTFGRKMVPQEANVLYEIPGNEISLAKKEQVKIGTKGLKKMMRDVLYDVKGSTVLKIFLADCSWSLAFLRSRLHK